MKPRTVLLSSFLISALSVLTAAGAGLDTSIAKNRMGELRISAPAGAKITVEQIRHEFWFGATLPGGVFTGRASPDDIAKFKATFTELFNAGVIEAAFKWHDMEKERGKVDYSIVDSMLAWAGSRAFRCVGTASSGAFRIAFRTG